MKSVKWMILILVFVMFLGSCNFQTSESEAPYSEETQVVGTATTTATTPPEPEVQPTTGPTDQPVADPIEELPGSSPPLTGWDAVKSQDNWVLVSYGDILNPTVVEPGTYVTISFNASDDQAVGFGGCNNYFTSYSADDNGNLTINGPIGSTRMFCEKGSEQETLYLGALESGSGYTLTENGELVLDYDVNGAYDEGLTFIPETALMDTKWVLTGYGSPKNLTPSKPGVVTTVIFSANGTLSGSTGCNNYLAQYSLSGGSQISIDLPSTNLTACGIGMEQEQAYLAILAEAQSFRLGIKALEITNGAGAVLRYSAQHLPLENVDWSLVAVNGQPVPEAVTANAVFLPAGDPENQVNENIISGNTGCNNFSGQYVLDGDTITAGPFGLTRMMCEEPAMRVEQAYMAVLDGVQKYQITLNRLVIRAASGTLLFYADRLPLEGTQWILTGIGSANNPQPPVEGGIFTASFDRDFGMPSGSKFGATGCRDYTATYAAGFDRIKINLPQTTKGSCSDDQLEAEQGYFLGLNAARDHTITGNTLYVYYQDSVLIFVGSHPAVGVGPLLQLDNTRWRLTSMDNILPVPNSEISIQFEINSDGRTGRVSGSGGCNEYNAEITGAFQLGPIINPAATCDEPEGVMKQEGIYLTALQTANSVTVNGSRLEITTEGATLYFTSSLPEPEEPTPIPTPATLTAVIVAPSHENVGQVVTYDGSLSTPEDEITAYRWWFTGDKTAEGVIVERTYNKIGAYDGILTVTDAQGKRSEASVKTKIHSYLAGPVWVLDEGDATLHFDGNTLSGNAGCNDYNAGYTASTEPGKSNEISIGSISVTQKECEDDVMEKEQAYLDNLSKVTSYTIDINRLTMSPNDASLTFYR